MNTPYSPAETAGLALRYLIPSLGRRGWVPPSSARALPPPHECRRIVVAGDLMATRRWQAPEVHPEIRAVVSQADLLIANCEGPVLDQPTVSRLGRERPSVDFVQAALESLGASTTRCVLSVANNHCLDHGADDVTRTVDALRRIGVTPAGHHLADADDYGVPSVELGGSRIVVVAWTEWLNSTTSMPPVWTDVPPSTMWSDESPGTVPLLFPHWGYELELGPRAGLRARAHQLMRDHQAVVIVGHHPHVVQPLEVRGTSICLYSAGNLLGPAIPLRWTMRLGSLIELGIDTEGVCGLTLHPVVQLPGPTLVPLHEAPQRLRDRLSRLLSWLPARGSEPSQSASDPATARR